LNKLATNAALHLTSEETDLLEKLTKYATRGGRYHIPKDEDGITVVTTPGEGERHTSSEQVLADGIIHKVKGIII